MDGDVVGLGEEFVERDALDLHGLGATGGEVRVVGEYAHAEGLGAFGDFAADAAETDDTEGLFKEFDAGETFSIPLAGFHRSGGLRHGPRTAEDVGKRELGGRHGVARGGVHDDHAAFGGGIDIDVVHADAGAAHDFE